MKKLLLILLVIILALPSITALFHQGFFQSDDGEWMIIRFSAFHQTLRAGEFPVRFLSRLNYEYGYPVANFLYPGFMYLAEVPKILGFGFVNSIKIIFGLSMAGSLIFVYLWLSKFFDKFSSIAGALLYLYAPYHLYDIYKRGSVGEVLALAIIPFILWQIERKNIFWTSIGIALLILSHNTLAVLFLPVVILYMLLDILIAKKSQKLSTIYYLLFTVFSGLGISSFFWIPALADLQYTVFSQTVVSSWSSYFADTSLIGLSIIFVFLLTIILFLTKKIAIAKHRLTILFFIIGILSLFFSVELSKPLWNFLPVSFIQFPFRFLSLTILCAAFLAAMSLSLLAKNLKIIMAVILLLLLGFSAKQFISPSLFFDKGDLFYATNEGTTTVRNEYMPKWVKAPPSLRPNAKVENLNGKEKINTTIVSPKQISFDVYLPVSRVIQVNTVYFPGWMAVVNGEKADIDYSNQQGLIRLNLTKGQNNVSVAFKETPIRLASDFISLLSFCLLILISLRPKKIVVVT
ncbi:MAG: 6-pyruvoyl-tetrahydropterin synthase-related protein [Candidatus Levybacteria bacterium]|nr:6-pyruvoyl-tetrahydropterin synthase-related protein [Candidatus Levybacteria bacterium]